MSSTGWRWFRNASGMALFALAGTMVYSAKNPANVADAGVDCAAADPEAFDYCSPDKCGPCAEGEGDCDPGQCQDGFECQEQGAVDHCVAAPAHSNLQVEINGRWHGICCENGVPTVTKNGCEWQELEPRKLTDVTAGLNLDCPEGDPSDCWCNGWSEPMHGINGWEVDASLHADGGGPVYPNELMETCVRVGDDHVLYTDWSDATCPNYRMR